MPFSPALGFSTMGDSRLSFPGACDLAERFGVPDLEIRVLEGRLDLPAYFSETGYPEVPSGLRIRSIGTSLGLLSATATDLELFYGFAEVAHRLQVPYLRVFGEGGAPFGDFPTGGELDRAARTLGEIRATLAARQWNVEPLLETHDVFSSGERCLALNERLASPLGILWDSHHTWRLAGESPAETWNRLGPLVRHIHYKDSVGDAREKEGYRYVLPGEGEYPHGELRAILRAHSFQGTVSLEWEKLWHDDLPPLVDALPPFTEIFSGKGTDPLPPHAF